LGVENQSRQEKNVRTDGRNEETVRDGKCRRERGRVFEERKRRVVGMRDVKPRHRLVLGSGS
jgi:hypothetical protein